MSTSSSKTPTTRPPVVVVMGHIDHGKSTLLDYIRSTNVVAKEVGGITQRMSAYEVLHKTTVEGVAVEKEITFLDTPGHESFNAIRARGASAADIAILVVSAEDGVKPQTLDALRAIKNAALPYIVGISKIDKPNANIDRVKQSLAENEIYVEGYGGEIPAVPFSGITGDGVNDLLDMILLVADVENFTGVTDVPSECIVVEANRDKVRGISATLIIKNGTLRTGNVLVSGKAFSPVRILENFAGKSIKEAGPSKPVRVVGWSDMPEVGGICFTFDNKKEAEKFIESENIKRDEAKYAESKKAFNEANEAGEVSIVPILLKADTSGSVEALKYEIAKIQVERVQLKIIGSGIGDIGENDIKLASGKEHTLIIGFNTKIDSGSRQLAERMEIGVHTFDIIYKMTEWLEQVARERAPRIQVEEQKGIAKMLKVFSVNKNKQVIGGRVEAGTVSMHDEVKIMRRDVEIGRGHIRELQQMKEKVGSVEEGKEFGAMVESKLEIAPGDRLEAFHIVTK